MWSLLLASLLLIDPPDPDEPLLSWSADGGPVQVSLRTLENFPPPCFVDHEVARGQEYMDYLKGIDAWYGELLSWVAANRPAQWDDEYAAYCRFRYGRYTDTETRLDTWKALQLAQNPLTPPADRKEHLQTLLWRGQAAFLRGELDPILYFPSEAQWAEMGR